VTLAIAPIANQNKVVLITPAPSADYISQAGE
jgi:ABC-type branched-subunit amino acid transport system substrate-binding protein